MALSTSNVAKHLDGASHFRLFPNAERSQCLEVELTVLLLVVRTKLDRNPNCAKHVWFLTGTWVLTRHGAVVRTDLGRKHGFTYELRRTKAMDAFDTLVFKLNRMFDIYMDPQSIILCRFPCTLEYPALPTASCFTYLDHVQMNFSTLIVRMISTLSVRISTVSVRMWS